MELGFVAAFVAMVVCMTVVFSVVYTRTGSVRRGVLAALLLGKAWSLSMYLLGIDRPVLKLYIVNKRYPWVYKEVAITANMMIFLAYLASLITIAALPMLLDQIPELRRLAGRVRQ